MNLFISNLFSPDPADRFYFLAVVLVVVISIVLHELAHGWAALRLGDPTPQVQGRMTGNPLVHMGPFSLVALAIAGIAWGQMPIDPSQLRGRYGEAIVSAAGPAMNLLLALGCMLILGVLLGLWGLGSVPAAALNFGGSTITTAAGLSALQGNLLQLLAIGATYNLLLMFFNLLPAPPLDGSHILANFSRPYARWVGDPKHHGTFMLIFIGAFMLAGRPLTQLCLRLMNDATGLVSGLWV